MSVLEVKKYGDPVLRKKAEKVERINWEIKNLIIDMLETMEEEGGIGLAAPQVGILKRIIVVRDDVMPYVFINPRITKKSRRKISGEEACLSIPQVEGRVKRAKKIEIEAIDDNGEEVVIKADDLFARVLQHEIDHLDGILFTDLLGFWQKRKVKKQLKEIEKQYGPNR